MHRFGSADSAFQVESGIPNDSAGRLSAIPGGPPRSLQRVSGSPGRYLVVAMGPDDPDNYGLRMYLVGPEPTGASFVVLAESRGMMDSYVLNPVIFTGSGRAIVIGDTGAEGSWGLVAYEIRKDSLWRLGSLDVAKLPSNGSDPYENPLPHARVFAADRGDFHVTFDTDLVLVSSGDNDRPLRRVAGEPLRFFYRAGSFTQAGTPR